MNNLSRYLLPLMMICLCSVWTQAKDLPLPPRPEGAMSGSQLKTHLESMSLQEREEAIYLEVSKGNVPDFLRHLAPVTVTEKIDGEDHTATYDVTPDYLALGSNDDYFLMPMTPILAQRLADLLQCNLPTRKMVDDIWSAASVKFSPSPIPPSPKMTTIPVFYDHNQTVWQMRQDVLEDHPLGELCSGHKKDVVVTPLLASKPGKVAIYGWHYTSGTPIQPLYLGHADFYADYSHGIRIVDLSLKVDGTDKTIPQVLADPDLSSLLSDEGAFSNPRYPIPEPEPENLVTNGSFENGFTSGVGDGWEKWEAPGSNPITFGAASINKHDGEHSQYWARSDTLPFEGGLYQTVTVEKGKIYQLRAWLKRQSTIEGTFIRMGYDLSGEKNGMASSVQYRDLTGEGDNRWGYYEEILTASGDNLTIFSRSGHTGATGGSNSYFYLDEVSLVPVNNCSQWNLY